MRRLIIICFATFMLAGCQNGNIFASIQNPVGNNTLAGAISTYGILDTAVIAYRGLPRCTKENNFSITNVCYKWSVLTQAQAYDKAANASINRAVEFQRNNPTLDASSYITAATAAVSTFKDFAVAAKLPGVQ